MGGRSRNVPVEVENRLWDNVNRVDSSCWEWLGSRSGGGRIGTYGVVYVRVAKNNYRHEYAHRVSWTLHNGPIPKDMEIDHLCRNRICVKPDHLMLVPRHFNGRQGGRRRGDMLSARTHCAAGHEYSVVGFYLGRKGRRRECKACHKIYMKRYEQKCMAGK